MAHYFHLSPSTIKEIMDRELGFMKISRRWVPHRLTSAQKVDWINEGGTFLEIPRACHQDSFQGFTTRDEIGLLTHSNLTIHMKRLALTLFLERHTIWAKTITLTRFFSRERLPVLETLPKGRKFNQDYFSQSVLPALMNENQ
jgi:hypothetical protein